MSSCVSKAILLLMHLVRRSPCLNWWVTPPWYTQWSFQPEFRAVAIRNCTFLWLFFFTGLFLQFVKISLYPAVLVAWTRSAVPANLANVLTKHHPERRPSWWTDPCRSPPILTVKLWELIGQLIALSATVQYMSSGLLPYLLMKMSHGTGSKAY